MKKNIKFLNRKANEKEHGTGDPGFKINVKRYHCKLDREMKFIFDQRKRLYTPQLKLNIREMMEVKIQGPIAGIELKVKEVKHNRWKLIRVAHGED